MNNKNKNLRTEIAENIEQIMLAYEAMAKAANIFKNISERYEQLGFSQSEVYNITTEVAAEKYPELYSRINSLEDPNLEQALLMSY